MLKTVYSCIHRITKRIEVGNYKRKIRDSTIGPRALIYLLAGARLSHCPFQSSERRAGTGGSWPHLGHAQAVLSAVPLLHQEQGCRFPR